MSASHMRIGIVWVCLSAVAGCQSKESSSKQDRASMQTPPADTAQVGKKNILNAWPNPDIVLIKDFSAVRGGTADQKLRIHMGIPLSLSKDNLDLLEQAIGRH